MLTHTFKTTQYCESRNQAVTWVFYTYIFKIFFKTNYSICTLTAIIIRKVFIQISIKNRKYEIVFKKLATYIDTSCRKY